MRTISNTLKNNKESDYTEIIYELGKNFIYDDNKDDYWSPAELSILFGTPIYDQCSHSQRLALNHLYWTQLYNQTAASEMNTIFFNRITAGVFNNISDYSELCDELEFECEQEKHHIRTFQRVAYKTNNALLGKNYLTDTKKSNLSQAKLSKANASSQIYIYKTFNLLAQFLQRNNRKYHSNYLARLQGDGQAIASPNSGLGGNLASRNMLQFFTINWGSSPFMACQYYTLRYTANSMLKSQESKVSRFFMHLKNNEKFIPAPTAISRFHFLDEAFHTTISQLLGRDLFRHFNEPTHFERYLSNLIISKLQKNLLGGFSGAMPGRSVSDSLRLMKDIYSLFRSPIFEFTHEDCLYWIEQIFCYEHNGFHNTYKILEGFHADLRRLFGKLDYLSTSNRELLIMRAAISIDAAINLNKDTFNEFYSSISL
ncbi:MAG: hypothetical protein AAGA40_05655 [Cyanobacteria bacterium P01_E01_bin.45]